MENFTACPLDCYDACRIKAEDISLKGDKNHPVTKGYLCPNMNHFSEYARIVSPRYLGKEISLDKAFELLLGVLKETPPEEVLYFRGSGNIGLMQRCTEHVFARMGAVGTSGSLCDGAGEAGIIAGRGVNYHLSPEMVAQSDVVVVWGRNIHTTHSHLLPFLNGKTLIVIDPVETPLASKADLHIQIKPRGDLHLALLLSRFAMIEGIHDEDFLNEHAGGYKDYYELTQTVRIKATLEAIGVSLAEIGVMLSMIAGKKCSILVGVGVQKYRHGADVLRAIDGFAAIMGLFGKSGCGVSYLGDSLKQIEVPFAQCKRKTAKPIVDFSKYNCVFVQGANPLAQMPASLKVREEFSRVKFKVYFGVYENETSSVSDLVIPAKIFLEKNDFRSSYGDYTLQEMKQSRVGNIGVSEYELAKELCTGLEIELEEEDAYLEKFRSQIRMAEGVGYRDDIPEIPYAEGFNDDEFEFLDEVEAIKEESETYFLITAKHPKGLNSQFYRPEGAFFHPEAGWEEGCKVMLSTPQGATEMVVKHDDRLRKDCVLIYSGTPDVNVLTPALKSFEGECAVYQEYKIKVEKI